MPLEYKVLKIIIVTKIIIYLYYIIKKATEGWVGGVNNIFYFNSIAYTA
jgi:hypothetical protein